MNGRTKTRAAAVTPAMLRERIGIRAVLKSLSIAVNERIRRATCPFCEGHSKNTLSFNEHFWKCHRCESGGDCFTLVRKIKGCGFRDAMTYIARLTGIPLQHFTPNQRRELADQKRQNERLDLVVDELAEAERALRLQYRDEVHCLERIARQTRERLSQPNNQGEESEICWKVLELALPQLREAVAAYYLLSFATTGERADFVLYPDQRDAAIQGILNRGTVRDDHGVVMEVDF